MRRGGVMAVIGHGIDAVSESRVAGLLTRERWAEGIFSEAERAIAEGCDNPARFYAGRYAGKEAVAKAMGTGFAGGVTIHAIDILRLPSDAPVVRLTSGASEMAERLGITGWLISISHCGDLAFASAIAVSD
jgi:holo-[acyl-carrier protein] synthase